MLALVNEELGEAGISALGSYGFEVLILPRSQKLEYPLSTHPDMNIFLGFGRLFCHQSYFEENKALLEKICAVSDLKLCLSDEEMTPKYPCDVLFNCVAFENMLFCNTKSVSRKILEAADIANVKIVNVKQGYTKCSVCAVSDRALITADKPIYDAAKENRLEALLITQGNVSLKGYDLGFIGGASGASKDKVFLCGDLKTHPDGDSIANFIEKQGKEPVCLTDGVLRDLGSIFFV